jgi:hypothetical protein
MAFGTAAAMSAHATKACQRMKMTNAGDNIATRLLQFRKLELYIRKENGADAAGGGARGHGLPEPNDA